MAIEGINFSKMLNFKKTEESKKGKASNETNPITDKKLTKDEQTILERLRKSGLSQYAAAVMITAMTGPMITSCVNQETTVNVDTSELQKTLKELVELQKLMLLQLQQNTEDNKALIEQNKQIMAILQSLLGTTEDISAQLDVAINLIKTLIEQSNKHDKEFLEKLDNIYNSGLEGNKLLEEILKANNEQNMTLSSIKTLLDNMSKDQGDLYELALKWFKKYEEGDIKHSEMLENIYKEMLKSNEISQKTQNQIKKLKEQLAAKEIKESEYWEKVIKLLESIDGKMDLLQVSIDMLNDSLKVGNEKLSEVIKDFHEDYKDGKITQEEYAKKVVENLIKSNLNDEAIIGKLDEVLKLMASGQLTAAEAMDKVIELLKSIENKLDIMNKSILNISDSIKVGNEKLTDIANNIYIELKEGRISQEEYLKSIVQKLDQSNIDDKTLIGKFDDVLAKFEAGQLSFAEAMSKVIELLGKIDSKLDDIHQTIKVVGEDIKVGNEKLTVVAEKIYKEYVEGRITQEVYFKSILEQLIKSNINDETMIGKFDSILAKVEAGQMTMAEAMSQVIALLKSIDSKLDTLNQSILNVSDSIKVGNEKLTVIAEKIYKEYVDGKINQEQYLKEIIQKITQSNINDQTIIGKFNDVLSKLTSGQLSLAEAMSKVIELLGKIDSKLGDIHETIKVVGEDIKVGNQKLSDIGEKIYNEFVSGKITQEEYLKQILEKLVQSNINDQTMIGKFDSILAKVEAGQITMAEAMSQVIALLKSIESKLDILNEAIKGIGDNILVGNSKLTDLVKNFYNDYKAGKITQEAYMNKVLEAMAKSNMNDEVMLKKFDEISKLIASGQLTLAEAMTKVIDLLNQIKDNTEAIKVAIQQLAKDFPKFAKEVINNQKESLLDLKDIKNNTTDINNTLNEIKANQKTANDNLIKISNNGDKIIANLEILKEQGSNQLTINQVKEFFGPAFDTFMALGIEIKNGMINIDDIRDAIEKNKVDLTKTNALIETLTNVVKNMDFGTDAMAQVITILNDMKASGTANQEAIMKAFNDALAKLGGIQGSLDALLTTANEINTNFKSFIGAAEGYADKFFTELQNITSGVSKNTTALESYAKQAQEAFLQSQKMQEEQKAILITIAEQMGKGDGNVDIDAIIAKLPNYTQILNEIKEEIGKRPSKDDMITAINGAKTDLTKTNALIQTLTDVVKNLDLSGSGGSADMTEVNRLVGLVLNYLDKAALDNAKNFEEYYKLAQKALDELMNVNQNTKPTTPTTRSSKKSNMPKGWRVYNDSSSMRQMINKYNREQVGNYQAMTSLNTDDVEREIGLV